jgi:hypothetical protein
MAKQEKHFGRLDDDKKQIYRELVFGKVRVYILKRYARFIDAAMKVAKAQIMLGANPEQARKAAAFNLLMNLQALQFAGVQEAWITTAIKQLDQFCKK